ncbi:MAG: NAD(P)-dependent oxidoreductase [Rhodospirillales bacterium CG15_BIG_FIL_POST_REV_8_21_14_020_66_15]|nr:MAG: NAD(P)-dependent oxidoreductase [Rhodospirillales bacterium CG15_BIG_FIL_POST_REV_8_21_14_020_66_15]
MGNLFCFGLGFSALTLARELTAEGWTVAGTCRTPGKRAKLRAEGIDAHLFDGSGPLDAGAAAALGRTDHLLISVPPGPAGDPALIGAGDALRRAASRIRWAGYLSTTGVYGDTGGAEVTEDSPLAPTSPRGEYRIEAEAGWRALGRDTGLPVHVFRLAGIYGPGRSVLDQLRQGTARRIDKPGHRFSRIHAADIANVLRASMARPDPGSVYNVCDDEPAPQADVVAHGAMLLGLPAPEAVPFAEAAKGMSEMALSFWRDNRVVSNARIKGGLGVVLSYPTYREGLAAILAAGG